jgi:hypothetical protein
VHIRVVLSASNTVVPYNVRMNLVDQNAEDVVIHLTKMELQLIVSLVQNSPALSVNDDLDKQCVRQGFEKIVRILHSLESSRQIH